MSRARELRQRRQQWMTEHPRKLSGELNRSQKFVLGLVALLMFDIIWVFKLEVLNTLYRVPEFQKPFFSTYIRSSMFTLYLLGFCFFPPWRDHCNRPTTYMYADPNLEDDNFYSEANTSLSDPTFVPIKTPDQCERSSGTESDDSSIRSVRFSKLAEVRHMSETVATEAVLARLSYQASVRAGEYARRQANKFSAQKVAKIALIFCILWFIANYTNQLLLDEAGPGIVTVLSSMSSLFILFLAACFPNNAGDKFTLSKLVAVSISILGLILVGYSEFKIQPSRIPNSIILALVSALTYAIYIVFLTRKAGNEEKLDVPMFFGFVGFFNLALLWPLFFILHYGHWEEFEWPTHHQWTVLIVNGLFNFLSEIIWLWSCFFTSSLIPTLAVGLTVPISMMLNVFLKKHTISCIFYLGTIPMILAFLTVSLLSYYDNWDPVLDLLKRLYVWICRRGRAIRIPDLEAEQTESLIGLNSGEHEA